MFQTNQLKGSEELPDPPSDDLCMDLDHRAAPPLPPCVYVRMVGSAGSSVLTQHSGVTTLSQNCNTHNAQQQAALSEGTADISFFITEHFKFNKVWLETGMLTRNRAGSVFLSSKSSGITDVPIRAAWWSSREVLWFNPGFSHSINVMLGGHSEPLHHLPPTASGTQCINNETATTIGQSLLRSSVPSLTFHTTASPLMGSTVEDFEQAKSKLSSLNKDPGNEVKLKIYALFKQVRTSRCSAGDVMSLQL
ncbi:hypothetical protein XENORESO_015744 [Xenotaenia resolanae]|uniref:ACB domain-containing protein n=1 Tax=Xenotaenia resolanae TaxID=208358 RepID=A0ABV0WNA9_9TELE